VGRRFLGKSTLEHLEQVLSALAELVAAQNVDVVVVAGDIFDTATPSAEAYALLGRALSQVTQAGAQVILTSGNHDSAARLGFLSGFTAPAGLHIITDPERLAEPVLIDDEHGPVYFFGIPFLEPVMIKHLTPEREMVTQQHAMEWAMEQIHGALPAGARSVVISHTFAAPLRPKVDDGGEVLADSTALEDSGLASAELKQDATLAPRDFTSGGVDVVDAAVFDGITYTALGHLHGRQQLSPAVRYSGAPLFYSFGEEGRRRGAWLVELTADGLGETSWVDLPIPRQIVQLKGELDHLLSHPEFDPFTEHWVKAILTDNTRPLDPLRRLQTRFEFCIELEHQPANVAPTDSATYAQRVKALTDQQIAEKFLEHVRNGEGVTPAEQALLSQAITQFEVEARA